jgi:hypothetical protein
MAPRLTIFPLEKVGAELFAGSLFGDAVEAENPGTTNREDALSALHSRAAQVGFDV